MSKRIKIVVSIGIGIGAISILSYLNVKNLNGNLARAIFGYILMYLMIRAVWKIPSKNTKTDNRQVDKTN